MPIGWPSAIAPPLTLTLSGSTPSSSRGLDADRGERLVDLDQVEVGDGQAGLLERLVDRVRRLRLQRGVGTGDDAVRADLGEHGRPGRSALRLAHHDDRARAVGDLRRRAGGDRAVLGERRAQLAERLGVVSAGRPRRSVNDDRVALALRDRDRHDLVVEQAVLLRGGGELVATGRRTRPAPRG